MVAPAFGSYLTTDYHLTHIECCSHGAVRRSQVATRDKDNAPQGRGYNTQEIARR
jgi:hypothetical protein